MSAAKYTLSIKMNSFPKFLWLLASCLVSIAVATEENKNILPIPSSKVPVEAVDSVPLLKIYRILRNLGSYILGKTSFESNYYYKQAYLQSKIQKLVPDFIPFPCKIDGSRSKIRPTSVNKLRPGDIDVIGAIGDSLTVGSGVMAASALPLFLVENRGLSFSIGGQSNWRKFLTLPNILKEFNPNLIGYSLGDSLSTHKDSQFNVAEGGSISINTPYMTKVLVQRMSNDPRVDIKQDWKMITYHIGGNDFCSSICYNKNPEVVVEKHKQDLLRVLRILRDNLPRAIVNLIPAPHLRILRSYNNIPLRCYFLLRLFCPCIIGAQFQNDQETLDEIMTRWQKMDFEISNDPEFERDDFTVVFQPFSMGYLNPGNAGPTGITDYSYTSYDCFHFSQKGNAHASNLLWNNIMEPVGRKNINYAGLLEKFNCPSGDRPFIYTKRNSNVTDEEITGQETYLFNNS